jgi:hypothetical protein
MKIAKRTDRRVDPLRLRAEIEAFIRAGESGEPVCGPNCNRCPPFDCSRDCPDIARALSSDPERFPLEARIAPLAFELKRLGVFYPCWSCEGHLGPDGSLWKIPRIWFYSESVVHVRVLAESIKALHLGKRLHLPWHIVITFSDGDNADTTFSLEPRLDDQRPSLAALQKDIDTIAEHLRDTATAEARKLSKAVG